jgi:hypothetical protein
MNNKCIYRSPDTTMCTFMTEFIKKLKTGMYMRDVMNAVLEHLGVLQVSFSIFRFFLNDWGFYLDSGGKGYE